MSIAALIALAAAAQAPASAVPSAPLQPLAFLVGWCWRGTFPGGGMADTHCFTPAIGGAFVRDRHVVAGASRPYSGESLYRWDPAAREIRFEYYSSDGSFGAGTVEPNRTGLTFPEQAYVGADGARTMIRSAWTRDGTDSLTVVNEERGGAGWHELWRMRWQRVSPAPADEIIPGASDSGR
jgi:hypothetical protein